MIWRIPPGLALEFRRIGKSTAVFNPESGDTHLLTPQGAGLLRVLANRTGGSTGELTAALNGRGEGFEVEPVLEELRRLGLVEAR